MGAEEEKLFRAIEKDQALIDQELAALTSLKRPLKIVIREGNAETTILARRLKGTELQRLRRELGEINPDLAKGIENVPLTSEQTENLSELMKRYIEIATGIPAKRIREEIDDERIEQKLFIMIVDKSSLKPKEVDDLIKFHPDT
jgi:hypothetical protein